jgi:excisionase family DNA binding protein
MPKPNRAAVLEFPSTAEQTDTFTRIERHKGFITVEEFADELQVSSKSVYRLIRKGVLPAIRLGKLLRLEPVTTAAWLRKRVS